MMSNSDSSWKTLYKIGGFSALIFILYSLVTMVLLVTIGGRPETARETLELLSQNRLVGLLRLDVLTLIVVPLYFPIFLSISAALRRCQPGLTLLGAVLALSGLTLFLATPTAFPLIPLAEKYAAAGSAPEADHILVVAESLMAADTWHHTGAMTGGILMLVAVILISVVMLKSESFSKWTAYFGILTHGLDLLRVLVSFFFPDASVFIMAVAGLLYLVWFPLLARDLFRLAKE